MNIPRAMGRGYLAFARAFASNKEKPNVGDHIIAVFLVCVFLLFVLAIGSMAWEWYQFNQLSAAEHLAKAKEACGPSPHCAAPQAARDNLRAIPATAAEFPEAARLIAQISQQIEDDGRERMLANFNGTARDPFRCDRSAVGDYNIVSFDDGRTWWKDDGRCTAQLQKKRDDDAALGSYWSTTVRVDTDMNSSWLPDEERVCQTYPDEKGRVSTVKCSTTGEGTEHNIPVVFWGGVNRNTVSNWRCRREKSLLDDHFVCRAID